jgi:hypothetical protein
LAVEEEDAVAARIQASGIDMQPHRLLRAGRER